MTIPTQCNSHDNNPGGRRRLEWWEIRQLEAQGCLAASWDKVTVSDNTDLRLLRNVTFSGEVSVGALSLNDDRFEGLDNATLKDVFIGDNVYICNIGGLISGCRIGNRAVIENTARVVFDPEAMCGILTPVAVLDETGSRPVWLYPGLSAQVAHLAAHNPAWGENTLLPMLEEKYQMTPVEPFIGDDAIIRDCGELRNVAVGREVKIEGASRLCNGLIINNAGSGRGFAYVGAGVDAENFIIEDGFVGAGSLLRNCYIGQGAVIDKGFTAHDTLAFANTSLENGEACAVFAGPYTVSMHKASLLIGCQLSFMNAGSGTNQSNHMYKLGPVHWGIMERGVKTASSSYVMWGAKIGPFSLVMGVHKNHPDASEFPFSYLFGDEKGATTVVPGMMLRSCGLLRDEKKWPTRDRRLKRKLPMHDRVHFPVLNPLTVGRMLQSIELIGELLAKGGDDDLFIRYKGMKFRSSALERAKKYYLTAIGVYLKNLLGDAPLPEPIATDITGWSDIGGQIVPDSTVTRAMQAESIEEIEQIFDRAAETYEADQLAWISNHIPAKIRARRDLIDELAEEFTEMTDDDRTAYLRTLADEQAMLTGRPKN